MFVIQLIVGNIIIWLVIPQFPVLELGKLLNSISSGKCPFRKMVFQQNGISMKYSLAKLLQQNEFQRDKLWHKV
ncbi:unnamed protein product [Rhizophagus irregularis]|nr:unnamed protein product [Rhizophagus irregularis]